jgi:anti-sigma regulatory factor (Ser/Thr protein kinase)
MTAPFEAEVLPQLEAISALTERVMDYLTAAGVDARTTHHVGLAFDELLTNLGSHGDSPDEPAAVRVVVEPDKVRAEVRDCGPAFDIRTAAEPALNQTIEEREIGGLGLFLIRQFASEIGYERRDGMNCTRFVILRQIPP